MSLFQVQYKSIRNNSGFQSGKPGPPTFLVSSPGLALHYDNNFYMKRQYFLRTSALALRLLQYCHISSILVQGSHLQCLSDKPRPSLIFGSLGCSYTIFPTIIIPCVATKQLFHSQMHVCQVVSFWGKLFLIVDATHTSTIKLIRSLLLSPQPLLRLHPVPSPPPLLFSPPSRPPQLLFPLTDLINQ